MGKTDNTGEPVIRALPTEKQFIEMTDQVITDDGYNDEQARAYASQLLTVANPDDETSWSLAYGAAHRAFTKTEAFEKAFREFVGYPERPMYKADRYTITAAEKEM